ncbi:MAG: PilT protein-like [Tardiphaga sp.]|nr:PilT protein-like [Tardiphaga sp.]
MIILDTNVLSEPFRPKPDAAVRAWFNAQRTDALFTCAPALAELRFGIERLDPGAKRQWLADNVDRLEQQFSGRILPFDANTANIYGRIVASREKRGRSISAMDGMIAAVALQHGASLATRDGRGFALLNLTIINPFDFLA